MYCSNQALINAWSSNGKHPQAIQSSSRLKSGTPWLPIQQPRIPAGDLVKHCWDQAPCDCWSSSNIHWQAAESCSAEIRNSLTLAPINCWAMASTRRQLNCPLAAVTHLMIKPPLTLDEAMAGTRRQLSHISLWSSQSLWVKHPWLLIKQWRVPVGSSVNWTFCRHHDTEAPSSLDQAILTRAGDTVFWRWSLGWWKASCWTSKPDCEHWWMSTMGKRACLWS